MINGGHMHDFNVVYAQAKEKYIKRKKFLILPLSLLNKYIELGFIQWHALVPVTSMSS